NWSINDIYSYFGLIAAKYIFAKNETWEEYIDKVANFWLPNINNLSNSFRALGINQFIGFSGIILGWFIFCKDSTFSDYIENASKMMNNIINITNIFTKFGLNSWVSFAALVLGKFIFSWELSWNEYLYNLSSNLNKLDSIRETLSSVGINKWQCIVGIVICKFIFAQNDSWGDYISGLYKYKDNITMLLNITSKYGVSNYISFAAIVVAKLSFADNVSWDDYFNKLNNTVSFWAGKFAEVKEIFNRYKDMPTIFRFAFQVKDALIFINETASLFMKGDTGVWGILSPPTWKKIHEFYETHLKGLVDIIGIVQSAVGLYSNILTIIKNWKNFGNWSNIVEVLDLVKNTLQIMKMIVDFGIKVLTWLGENAYKSLINVLGSISAIIQKIISYFASIISVISAIISVMQIIKAAIIEFGKDLFQTLVKLFFGFSFLSGIFYISLGFALCAIGTMASTIFGLATLGSILPIVGVVLIVIGAIISFFSSRTKYYVKYSQVKKIESQVTEMLKGSLKNVAWINSQVSPENKIFMARQYSGASHGFHTISLFSANSSIALEMKGLSDYYAESSRATKEVALMGYYTRFWVVQQWRQADDFVSRNIAKNYPEDSEGFENKYKKCKYWKCKTKYATWDGDIQLRNEDGSWYSLEQKKGKEERENLPENAYMARSIDGFLLVLNETEADYFKENIRYRVGAGVSEFGLKDWTKTMEVVGKELSYWFDKLSKALDKEVYTSNYPKAFDFRFDMGTFMVEIATDKPIPVYIKRIDGSYEIFNFSTMKYESHSMNEITILSLFTRSTVYTTPGKYEVWWSKEKPISLEVLGYENIDYKTPIVKISTPEVYNYTLRIINNFNGTTRIRLDVIDENGITIKNIGIKTYNSTLTETIALPPEIYFSDKRLLINLSTDLNSDGTYDIYNEISYSFWADMITSDEINRTYNITIFEYPHIEWKEFALYNNWTNSVSVYIKFLDINNKIIEEFKINKTEPEPGEWYPIQLGDYEDWPTDGISLPDGAKIVEIHAELLEYIHFDEYVYENWKKYDRTYGIYGDTAEGDLYGICIDENLYVGIEAQMEIINTGIMMMEFE
ncbi:MAG: hypothetical protein AB1779_08565, partial [Candidatus Thermoplasmatota archaeon]